MRRRLLNLLTLLSLLLCVAGAVLWVRSYRHGDLLDQNELWFESLTGSGQSYGSSLGRLWTTRTHGTLDRYEAAYEEEHRRRERREGKDPSRWRYVHAEPRRANPPGGRLGFHFVREERQYGNGITVSIFSVGMPHASVVAVAAALPSVRVTRWLRRRRRQKRGACQNCGYDLRATPDCCPECGLGAAGATAVAPAAPRAAVAARRSGAGAPLWRR